MYSYNNLFSFSYDRKQANKVIDKWLTNWGSATQSDKRTNGKLFDFNNKTKRNQAYTSITPGSGIEIHIATL